MTISRNNIEALTSGAEPYWDTSAIDDIISYFNRVDDRTQIQTGIKTLYGYGVRKEQDPNKADSYYEVFAKRDFTTQVDNGMVEAISIGFGNKVVNALATLFTEDDQTFMLDSETSENVEKAEELLEYNRKEGGFITTMVKADKLSIQCGSSAVLLTFENKSLKYQQIAPNQIRAFYHKTIMENGNERPVDQRDIEDATCVLIRLNEIESYRWNYLAIFGQSDIYPKGRWVTYEGSNSIKIPTYGEKGSIDFEIDGVPCNPLSYYASINPDLNIPEYPISILYSNLTESSDLMPTTASLYNSCLDFSRAASHTLSKSQEGVAGTKILELTNEGEGKPLPRNMSGNISLLAGQSLNIPLSDTAAYEIGYKILKGLMIDTAAGYSVPDYMIVSEDYTYDAASGIALQVKTKPLKKFRDLRVKDNKLSIRKIFEIEKTYISLFSDAKESDINLLQSCNQTWDPGTIKMPENKKEEAERIKLLGEIGVLDVIGKIREYYKCTTDEEAIVIYEKMKERKNKYPPLEEPTKKTLGLLKNNAAQKQPV